MRIGYTKEKPILAYYIHRCYFSVTTSCRRQPLEGKILRWRKCEKPLELTFNDKSFYVLEDHVILSRYMILCCVFLFLSCSQLFPTEIKKILDDPREYDGKTVTISGTVTESVNLLVMRYYSVRDDTGEIIVVTERAVPHQGMKVRVTGEVKQAFSIGNRSVVVVYEEKE